jgi:hypothetical protein
MRLHNCEFVGADRVCKSVTSVLEEHTASIFTAEVYFEDISNELF